MAFLMGFEIKNLWALKFLDKSFMYLNIIWIFVFLFSISTIYFFVKYLSKNSAKDYYENCHPGVKGIFYMNFIFGIRNLLLGFLHQILPDDEKNVHKKLICLIQLELLFLIGMIFLIKKSFFISKLKQWVTNVAIMLRIFLLTIF